MVTWFPGRRQVVCPRGIGNGRSSTGVGTLSDAVKKTSPVSSLTPSRAYTGQSPWVMERTIVP